MGSNKDKPKRRKADPIPVIGVRGSSTKISLPKTVAVGGAALLIGGKVLRDPVGPSPYEAAKTSGLSAGIDRLKLAITRSREQADGNFGLGVAILAGSFLFGKAIDRKARDLPVKFGG